MSPQLMTQAHLFWWFGILDKQMVPCTLTQLSTALLQIAHTLSVQVPTNCQPFENENICYFHHGTHCFCFMTNLLKKYHTGFMTFSLYSYHPIHSWSQQFIDQKQDSKEFVTMLESSVEHNSSLWSRASKQRGIMFKCSLPTLHKRVIYCTIHKIAMRIYKFYVEIKRWSNDTWHIMSSLCPPKTDIVFKITIEFVIDHYWILI